MFGILLDFSTLLISICGFFLILLMVIPNFTRMKSTFWIIIKSFFIVTLVVMIILFAVRGEDLYFYFGSIFGLSFSLQALILRSKNRVLLLSFAFVSFSFIFLSFNQKIMFFTILVFSYILFLSISAFSMFQKYHVKDTKTSKSTTDFFINLGILGLLILPFILICSFLFSSSEGFINIWIEGDSLITVFNENFNLIIFSIIALIFLILMSIYLALEIISNNKKRAEESWYM